VNRYYLLTAVIVTASLVACASVEPQPSAEAQASGGKGEKGYVTGSRIPVRDGSTSADVKGVTSKEGIDSIMHPKGVDAPPRAGG
jgi:hypothetical protein